MHVRTASALAALIWSSAATPTIAAPLQPIEPWHLDYGQTQCTAARSFGTAADPVILGIIPSVSGSTYRLLVSRQRTGPRFAQELGGTINFGRGPIKTSALYFGGKDVKLSIHQSRMSAAQLDEAAAAPSLVLRYENGDRYEFALSNMPAVLDALNKCTADLQLYWNLSGRPNLATAGAPVGDIAALFNSKDFPAEALRQQGPTEARYQLLVNERGAVAACDVLVPSGAPVLDSAGCQLLTEVAKFKPATDRSGKPVRSVWTTPPVTWGGSDQQVLNSGCRWVTDNGSTIDNCGPMPGMNMRQFQVAPPPPPPPPSGGTTS